MTTADPAPELLSRERLQSLRDFWASDADDDLLCATALSAYDDSGRLWRNVAADLAAKLAAAEQECQHGMALIRESQFRAEAAERERDACRMQAQGWAMEARAHKSSVHEAYQATTGATGEPGDWNGAEPIKEALATYHDNLANARAALRMIREAVEGASVGALPAEETIGPEFTDEAAVIVTAILAERDRAEAALAAAQEAMRLTCIARLKAIGPARLSFGSEFGDGYQAFKELAIDALRALLIPAAKPEGE